MPHNDFFIGYQPTMPTRTRQFLTRWIIGFGLLLLMLAGLLAACQSPFATTTFDRFNLTSYTGQFMQVPYPHLLITESNRIRRILVMNPGKHTTQLADFHNQFITLKGKAIRRGTETMIEISPNSVKPIAAIATFPKPVTQTIGPISVVGEIVDSKCFLGAMKPGNLKPHRACASLCIRGGAPPMLFTQSNSTHFYILATPDNRPINNYIQNQIAQPVQIDGTLIQRDNLSIILTDQVRAL